ncbi:MAG: cytochrome c biogenesis protein CcdA [Oscillospiraceae bacterium]
MQYIILFLEGIITFISPCLLPMLPIYISYFAGGKAGEDKHKALINSIGFVLGFSVVFITLGAFAATLGMLLMKWAVIVNIITGAVVVILGLNFLGIILLNFLNRFRRATKGKGELGFFSSVLFGIVFSIGWTPCVGAFLGSALMLASQQGSVITGVLMLLCYSLGLGIPFIAAAVLIERLKSTFTWIKKHYNFINRVSGILLVVMGVLMMTGLMGKFLSLISF